MKTGILILCLAFISCQNNQKTKEKWTPKTQNTRPIWHKSDVSNLVAASLSITKNHLALVCLYKKPKRCLVMSIRNNMMI